MIDPKYFDMLKEQLSVEDRISNFLNDTIDKLVTCAICDFADKPLPEETGFKAVHVGMHKLNKRKLIIGDTADDRNVHVEFSPDFTKAYVAKRNYAGYQEVLLNPTTAEAAKSLFEAIKNKLLAMSFAALPDNPKLAALAEFLAETRYGTNEYLCNEYLTIYKRIVNKLLDQIDNDEAKEAMKEPLMEFEVTDIMQFLKDEGIEEPDVHIVNS